MDCILKIKSQIVEYLKNISIIKILGMCGFVLGAAKLAFNYFKPDNQAQSHEGNMKAKRLRIKRKIKVRGHTTGVAQYDDTNTVVESCCADNFCTFTIMLLDPTHDTSSETAMYMNSICVGGSVFAIPRHFWLVIEQARQMVVNDERKLVMQLRWKNQNCTIIPWKNIDVYYPDQDYLVDIAFMRIRSFTSKRDIRHFFVKEDDDLLFHEAYLYGLRSKRLQSSELSVISVDGVRLMSTEYKMASVPVGDLGCTKEIDIRSPVVYEYFNCKTISGDCGALLMFVNSKLNNRIIAGLHVGGTPCNGSGFAAPIFQEDLNDAFEHFNTIVNEIIRPQPQKMEILCQMDSEDAKILKNMGANVIGRLKPDGNGKKIICTLPQKTKISESCVFEWMEKDFGEHKMEPAKLRPFIYDSEKVSPFYKGYKKMLKYSPLHIPIDIQHELIANVYADLMCAKSVYSTGNAKIRVLDDYETINGIVGLKQIDLSTSPGFPYVFSSKGTGKRSWFDMVGSEQTGQPIFKMKPELLSEVEIIEQDALKGIMHEIYFIDTMKDETRPINKVKEGKTRIFQVGPMSLTILIRKYFGCFIAHLSSIFIDGESAIGINCNSEEWDKICRDMFSFSEFQGVGDFSDYDASILCEFADMFAEIANEFYNERDQRIRLLRKVLCRMCIQAYHIVGNVVCDFDSIMNSGIAITAHLNTVVGMFIMRLAFRHLTGFDMSLYQQFVKSKFYGDDNWLSIKSDIIDKFNMITIQSFMAQIGYKYTSVTKADVSVPYVGCNEVSFLKRTAFYRDDLMLYVGRLDLDVVYEIPRWSESDPRNMADQMQRFNATLTELANYGKDEFLRVKKIFIRYCVQLAADYHDIRANDLCSYGQVINRNYGRNSSMPKFLSILES